MKKETLNSNFLSISGYIFQPEVMLTLCLHFEDFSLCYKDYAHEKMVILGAANAQLLYK